MKFKVKISQIVEIEALNKKEAIMLLNMWSTDVVSHGGVTSIPITHSYYVKPQRKVKIVSFKQNHDLDANRTQDA